MIMHCACWFSWWAYYIWGLQVTSSISFWGCIWKGCLERGVLWRANSRLKAIEDFNLEHELPGLLARTCVRTLPCWESMWQYPVKIINIQVDITFINPNLIKGVSFTCHRNLMAWMTMYCHIGSQHGRVPTHVRAGRPGNEGSVGGMGPNRMKMWSSLGHGNPCISVWGDFWTRSIKILGFPSPAGYELRGLLVFIFFIELRFVL